MDLLSSSGFGSLSYSIGMQMFSAFFSIVTIPVFFLLVALVLYYFTGEKKRADEFMPNLMAQSVRIFSYVWMFILSVIALIPGIMVLQTVLYQILPLNETGYSRYRGAVEREDFDSETFVQGLIMLALVFAAMYAMYLLQRHSVKVSKIGGTVSTKLFLTTGTVVFSIISFITLISGVSAFISFLFETDRGLDSGLYSAMIVSVVGFGIYLSKTLSTLRAESKK